MALGRSRPGGRANNWIDGENAARYEVVMALHISGGDDLATRLGGTMGLLDRALRRHVLAILSGLATAADFQALFQGLRYRSRGRRRFRDIADFIAHLDQRDRGPIAELVRDVFESARVFTMVAAGRIPAADEARAAGHANLRLATDASISSVCAMNRKAAGAAIDRAADHLNHGLHPSDRDAFVFDAYCNRVKWHPAFHDHELLHEFVAVLRDNKLLEASEQALMESRGDRLALFVLALLHGVEIALEHGEPIILQAGFFNRERRLEVKAHIVLNDLNKPVFMPLCVFLTDLKPEGRCDEALLSSEAHGWTMPIVLDPEGMLISQI